MNDIYTGLIPLKLKMKLIVLYIQMTT